jgi:2-polyprenyl-3-methyl-5-hydroxy-6-metoxy-1,4-benzoquinol methylase
MVAYDKYYQEENYFGEAYKEFIAFFSKYDPKGRLLDLGCGQGRDSIEMAKLGYSVTGVDISKVGINQMISEANQMNLNITGIVEDIYTFDRINEYDIILLDSMFHFHKKDIKKETEFVLNILKQVKKGTLFCNFFMKSKKNELYIKSLVKDCGFEFEVLVDDYARYTEAYCDYHMYVIKKI